jgi:flagellar hook-associated protein 3 FlgL
VELTVQGNNETYSAEQRSAMAIEVREIQGQILSIANTQDSNGEYLFAGYQGRVKPFSEAGGVYSYNGDMGQREIQVSASRAVADGDNGFDVFMDVPTAVGGSRNMFDTVEQIAVALEADTRPGALLDDLHTIIQHVGSVRAAAGGRLNTVERQKDVNDDFILTMEISRSDVEDLDYAEAVTRFNKQQVALEAAQKSFVEIQGLSLFNFIR